MPMMPQDPSDRPEQPAAEAPAVGDARVPDRPPEPTVPAAAPNEHAPQTAPAGDQPHRRRRRRRRRRGPRPDAAVGSSPTALAERPDLAQNAPAQPAVAEGPSTGTTEQAAVTQAPTGEAPRKRRRRRRRRPPHGVHPAPTSNRPTPGASGEVVEGRAPSEATQPPREQAPRYRQQRHRQRREDRSRDQENRGGPSRETRRDEDRASAGGGRGRSGKRGTKERRHGRDRDDFHKKPVPKVYRLESIVDRGFEDVADPATEGGTRRVDWIIVKRTTADQRTARALAATYVLQRDGAETEFAQLSAARAAVHKTISHPEKLTLSKADHAAARGAKK